MVSSVTVGMLFGVTIGILAGDRGMVEGTLTCWIAGLAVTPFVARMWS